MARKPNDKQRNEKREMIIERAREIFTKKGFLSVTMKDIVDACGISRGGLYLYFSSVEEIFQAVITSRDRSFFAPVREAVDKNADFNDVLDLYFQTQKERLLNMENSILMATYEYYSVQNPDKISFRDSQIEVIKQSILDIINLGINQGVIENVNIDNIVQNYVFMIEGMSIFGLFLNITESQVNAQIQIMKSLLKYGGKGDEICQN